MHRWKAHRGKVASLSFSRDGRLLASCTGSGRDVFIWNATTGELVRKLTVKDGDAGPSYREVHCVAFGLDSDLLAVSRYHWVEVWETIGWRRFAEAHCNPYLGIPYDISIGTGPTPRVATSSMSFVSVWRLPDSPADAELKSVTPAWPTENASQVSFSADGGQLATHTISRVEVRDSATGAEVRVLEHPRGNYGGPVRFSPDSSRLAFCYTKTIESHPATLDDPTDVIRYVGHTNKVWALRYTPDGRSLVSASSDGTVRVWEAATGLQKHCFEMNVGKMLAADVSPDGTMAAVGGATGEIVVWDLE